MERLRKEEYYLQIARQVAQRGTCLRRRFGAIIVKDDAIVSTGYVGAPRGYPNCISIQKCLRKEAKVPPGERYELCRSVHAEMNAIVNAARVGANVSGGEMYLYGEDIEHKNKIVGGKPCKMCRRVIINAGLEKVITKTEKGLEMHHIHDWVIEAERDPFKEMEKGY